MKVKDALLALAKTWRENAQSCDDKFSASAPAQTQVAVATLQNCAEELEELAGRIREK